MSNSRSVVIVALALLLLAGPANASEQAAPAQGQPQPQFAIAGIYVQPSADLLRRFGIITGDPGGHMRFADTITRAEMAKVVVSALDMTTAATAASLLPPAFADVKGHWASGFITVARLLRVASGYGDGTFQPDAPVTYAEAITFLLRAAGVRPDGPWPDAYLEEARVQGILDERLAEAMQPGAPAQRGGVFLLAERAFTRIRDTAGTTLLQRSFHPVAPRVEARAVSEGGQVLVTGKVEGAAVVYVHGRPALVTGGVFALRVPSLPGAREVLVFAVADTGAQTVQRVPIQ